MCTCVSDVCHAVCVCVCVCVCVGHLSFELLASEFIYSSVTLLL